MKKYCGHCGSSLKTAASGLALSGDTSQQAATSGEDAETVTVQPGAFTLLNKGKPVIIWGDGDWQEYGDDQEKKLNRVLQLNNPKAVKDIIGTIGKSDVVRMVQKMERYAKQKDVKNSMEVLILVPEQIESQFSTSYIKSDDRAVRNRKPEKVTDAIINIKHMSKNEFVRCVPYIVSLKNTAVQSEKSASFRRRLTY